VTRASLRTLATVLGWSLIALALGSLSTSVVNATADYARQTGQPCGSCHMRPEGGGELSAQGIAYARGGYQWPVPEGVESYTPSRGMRLLRLLVGYIHLTVTVLWFGTIFYIHIVVRPQQLTTGIPRLQGLIGWVSIGLMAVTGIVMTLYRRLETGAVFVGAFGTVLIIKLVLFGAMVLLAAIATVVLTPRLQRAVRSQVVLGSATSEITSETLPLHDGQEGRRAVVAVSGKLYEVTASRLWRNGLHIKQHQAGQDLTAALKGAPHSAEVLEKVPVIGELHASPSF
jgi:predicted heme/steroid binding protein